MFSIERMTVDGNGKVVSLFWCYETDNGKYFATHTLNKPEGDIPVALVTNDIAVGWLTGQADIDTGYLEEWIANDKALKEYEATFCEYLPNNQGRFTKTVDPDQDPVATPY